MTKPAPAPVRREAQPPRRALDAPVRSPCISICRIDPGTGLCEGCLRTLDEIAAWGALDDRARRAILVALDARRIGRDAAAPAATTETRAPGSLHRP